MKSNLIDICKIKKIKSFSPVNIQDGQMERRTDGKTNKRTDIFNYRVHSLLKSYCIFSLFMDVLKYLSETPSKENIDFLHFTT